MRYDTQVTFIDTKPAEYNPDTGRYDAAVKITAAIACHVHDLSVKEQVAIFGKVERGAVVAHHRGNVVALSGAEIGDVKYRVYQARQVRGKASYVLTETRSKAGDA